ncbi:MAG: aldehyde reductase [Hyphomonadaceae bacterium]|nr:aldehyde reductase [Hyphomonadaceae bacterium]
MSETVLVTGGSGFIATHCIIQLLQSGRWVRASVRSLRRENEVRAMVAVGGADAADRLTFIEADLEDDLRWNVAAAGCDYVLHVASPFPPGVPKHEDELIVPAREGALRVLRAAKLGGVKRVVMTSSFAAIGYGHAPRGRPFTEADWTNLKGRHLSAYVKSKTIAEAAAWDFIARDGGAMELSVINPVAVLGPVLGQDFSTSIQLIKRLLEGAMPGLPRFAFGLVDVRDVAELHLRAMTQPEAAGQRFLATNGGFMWVRDIARVLKERMGEAAARVPSRAIPDLMVRLAALGDPALAMIAPELGLAKPASNEKARRMLGWRPRSDEEAIVATADSLIRLGLVKVAQPA